jgi:hypothetical protein
LTLSALARPNVSAWQAAQQSGPNDQIVLGMIGVGLQARRGSNIAFRTGRRIHWNDEQERIVGDSEASRYLRRKFRKDYKL